MATGKNILRVAVSQLGIKESPANSNRVKYNTWYYGKEVSGGAYPWCMAFVQWCYDRAGAPLPFKTASCGALLRWYLANQPECVMLQGVDGDKAQPGDIVIFDFPGGADTDHTGIFESRSDFTVTTIDGNTGTTSEANGGAVMRRTRDKSVVKAYIRPRELEEDLDISKLTGAECYEILLKANEYAASLATPEWMKDELEQAKAMGITDGTRPLAMVQRGAAAIMAKRSAEKAVNGTMKILEEQT